MRRFAALAKFAQAVLVNGTPGFVSRAQDGRALSVVGFTFRDGKIIEMNAITDPERIETLRLPQ
jgi:RNA polymerase sigma-70 factor (ECF subfamily)